MAIGMDTSVFTVMVGPLASVCFAAMNTASSSVGGFKTTVPLTVRVAEGSNAGEATGIGARFVLTDLISVGVLTGTLEITAVARLSAVITTS